MSSSSFASSSAATSSRQAPPPSLLAMRLEQLASSSPSPATSTSAALAIPSAGSSNSRAHYLDLPTTPTLLNDPHYHAATNPGSPMPGTGIVPPYGTPQSLNGSYMPSSGSSQPTTPNKMHFDPYPAPPAPTPASSYLGDAAPVHALSLAGTSVGTPHLLPAAPPNSLSVSAPWPASLHSPTAASPASPSALAMSPATPNFFPSAPPNSLTNAAPWPSTSGIPGLTQSLAQLSTSPTRGTAQLTPRPRRRSSLSIVMTPSTATASASTENSQGPTPIEEDVNMDLTPIDEHSTIDTPPRAQQPLHYGGARPRTLTADASAAAAALLGTQGAALALGSKRDKVYVCDECGKMFRSSSSLAQHRADHSQSWRAASQPQLPSHQQVQLLEAAKILATLNQAPTASNGPLAAGRSKSNFGSGTTSSESTIPSSPSADDDLVFPMQDDGPSTMA